MDFSTKYFGKNLDDLVYQDIVEFFSESQTESNSIEFKSYSTDKSFDEQLGKIYRGICSMLNSDGGILIWGSPQKSTSTEQNEEQFQGELFPIKEMVEHDRLINKVTDNISSAPNSIKLKILNENTDFLCVFEVNQSEYKPHQFNNVYYIRLDGQSRPAPHYLIEALFKQIKFPNIEGYLKIKHFHQNARQNVYILNIEFWIWNFSELENEYDLNLRAIITKGQFRNRSSSAELRLPNIQNILYFGEPFKLVETIRIQAIEFDNDNFDLDLIMFIGGRKSPMKISKYKLRLNDTSATDFNELIIEKEENKTFVEMQNQLGISKEQTLKTILGR